MGTATGSSASATSSGGRPHASLPNIQAVGPASRACDLGVVQRASRAAVRRHDPQAGLRAARRRRPRAWPRPPPAGGTGCPRTRVRTCRYRGRRRRRRRPRRARPPRRRCEARSRRCPGRGRWPAARPGRPAWPAAATLGERDVDEAADGQQALRGHRLGQLVHDLAADDVHRYARGGDRRRPGRRAWLRAGTVTNRSVIRAPQWKASATACGPSARKARSRWRKARLVRRRAALSRGECAPA